MSPLTGLTAQLPDPLAPEELPAAEELAAAAGCLGAFDCAMLMIWWGRSLTKVNELPMKRIRVAEVASTSAAVTRDTALMRRASMRAKCVTHADVSCRF